MAGEGWEMTELKTLKDLVNQKEIRKGDAYILKQEAIKWVKGKSTYYSQSAKCELFVDEKQKEIIKYIFNITDEELDNSNKKGVKNKWEK